MTAWWTDLPDGSVVLDREGAPYRLAYQVHPTWKDRRKWYSANGSEEECEPPEDCIAIHVPVTDQEPPVGSLVETDEGTFWTLETDGLCYRLARVGTVSQRVAWPWESIRPRVTRILRWGES